MDINIQKFCSTSGSCCRISKYCLKYINIKNVMWKNKINVRGIKFENKKVFACTMIKIYTIDAMGSYDVTSLIWRNVFGNENYQ